ncbi:hypothetical protein [Kibdelosporangium aridum]|uniref:hypothetical protein n=1 Tax=Kibdelosporangium aridum TaxID=2030 RepID=UPI000A60DFA6
MLKKLLFRYGLAATAGVALAVMSPAVQVDLGHDENEAHATTAVEVEASSLPKALADDVEIQAWPVPTRRSYYITASCSQHASAIRRGAAAWQGLTEGGGTPVECRNSYITDCGGGGRIVGCNWGRGQRIALYMGGVGDDALLAAHEFGHNWYGHSTYRCAGWGSPQEVMAPSICTLRGSPDARQ